MTGYYVPTRADCYEVSKWLLARGKRRGFTNIDVLAACGEKGIECCSGGTMVKHEFAVCSGSDAENKKRLKYDLLENEELGIVFNDCDLVEAAVQRPAPVVVAAPVEKVVEKVVEVDSFKKKIEAERDELKEKLKILDAKHQAIVKEFNEAECELKVIERILR